MIKEELVDRLLDYFKMEDVGLRYLRIPRSYFEKRLLLRGIINCRYPFDINEDILKMEDQLLQLEYSEKEIVDVKDIIPMKGKIGLWKGDITTLKIQAIVNAGNSSLLGCFIPNHSCIDNQIHTYAGMRLRLYCYDMMGGKEESVGCARLTLGYQLPCDYIIHTVGPVVDGELEEKEITELQNCYRASLDLALKHGIKTVAFLCISTGMFHFPRREASEIAIKTVSDYLEKYPDSFEKIIFNVYLEEDYEIYFQQLNMKG